MSNTSFYLVDCWARGINLSRHEGGRNGSVNMGDRGYEEAEELVQIRRKVCHRICVIGYYLLYQQEQQHGARQVNSLHVSVVLPQL